MIKEIIYQKLREKETRHHHRKRDKLFIHPSSASNCIRASFYRYTEEEETNPVMDAGLEKMWLGEVIHSALNGLLEDAVYSLGESSVGEIKGIKFAYEPDGIVEMNGEKFIIEFKSVYSAGWSIVEKEPKPEHLTQLALYMELEKVDHGILLYLDRGSGHMIEYTLNRGKQYDEIILNAISRLQTLIKAIESKEAPAAEFPLFAKKTDAGITFDFQKDGLHYKIDWHCQWGKINYCPWFLKCRSEQLKELDKGARFIINDRVSQ